MDKNIVAFLREDARTIGVRFFQNGAKERNLESIPCTVGESSTHVALSPKEYTYLTSNPDIKVGDFVVVLVSSVPKMVIVTSVHEEMAIEPNESVQYKWIVGKVDIAAYVEEQRKNKELSELLASFYRTNMKKQFRAAILGSVDEDTVKRITNIIRRNVNV